MAISVATLLALAAAAPLAALAESSEAWPTSSPASAAYWEPSTSYADEWSASAPGYHTASGWSSDDWQAASSTHGWEEPCTSGDSWDASKHWSHETSGWSSDGWPAMSSGYGWDQPWSSADSWDASTPAYHTGREVVESTADEWSASTPGCHTAGWERPSSAADEWSASKPGYHAGSGWSSHGWDESHAAGTSGGHGWATKCHHRKPAHSTWAPESTADEWVEEPSSADYQG
ncbi:hypothetical protein IWQ57_000829 [Coemansia nantahalensis]|uniref:Uncharacterized protein n=1 Tax=Coemansia nantahalensis TaxID=2789366 RepID=A0ACC1K662_9FUNG|nr:hypothetical protein IWQ57_000829 [Coemansia nantahalensis]